ncbi:hypothetical protein D1007_01789 [Hordeum vulgare]|nr:hypothetical protein D1007_01789 [Hordeum vulgare]
MVRAVLRELRCRKDNSGIGRRTRRGLMSQIEEDSTLEAGGVLASVVAAFAMTRVSLASGTMYEDPVDAAVLATMHDTVVYHRGTFVRGADSCFDPLCIWGNEININKHQDITEL